MMSEEILLEFKHVTDRKRRRGFGLSDITFSLPKGYICGIMGKNGAGKTTLLSRIIRQYAYEGEILLNGEDIRSDPPKYRGEIGFISEDRRFLQNRTAEANARMIGPFYEQFSEDYFMSLSAKMLVPINRFYKNLSRGEQIKFQLAFAMACKPVLYLMDEPTAGMDPVFRKEFYEILSNILEEENASVLMTTHIESDMECRADFVGIMEEGKLKKYGIADEVLSGNRELSVEY